MIITLVCLASSPVWFLVGTISTHYLREARRVRSA